MVNLTPPGAPVPFGALGLIFDDMLLQPNELDVILSEATTCIWFSRNIRLNVLLPLAIMDTVTETRTAVTVARKGGIGILHHDLSIDDQAYMVDQVKRSEAGMVTQPVTTGPGASLQEMDGVCIRYRISGLPVVDDSGMLLRIIANRDLCSEDDGTRPVSEVMTKIPLVAAPIGISNDDTLALLAKNKIEKLPVIDSWGRPKGLVTLKDFVKADRYPNVARDDAGRLRVDAAADFFSDAWEWAMILAEQGVDCVTVDTIHGHSRGVIDVIQRIKADPATARMDVIGGNVAAYAGTRALVEAGADGTKVDVGPGSICTTHVVAGVGVPQVTVIHDAARAARPHDVPVIRDGGLQYSDGIAKTIVAGANSVMFGSLLIGCEESPGDLVFINDKQPKTYRGMGSLGVMVAHGRGASYSKDRYSQDDVASGDKLIPEGIEGQMAYRGPLTAVVYQLADGLRRSISCFGARTIDELQEHGRFARTTAAGLQEPHPYDIQLTVEASNY